jgi:membrane-bound serine protease (ClpP class)
MNILLNPNLVYLLIIGGVMFGFASLTSLKPNPPRAGMLICLAAALFALSQMRVNPWGLVAAALSPLPYMLAIRQPRLNLFLLITAIVLLEAGSFITFLDQKGLPQVSYTLAGVVSLFCAQFIWISIEREIRKRSAGRLDDPSSVIGTLGEAASEIHFEGFVLAGGEKWRARGDHPIPAGSQVRILRRDGYVLTVKKVERLS